jgi:hypothetical protein
LIIIDFDALAACRNRPACECCKRRPPCEAHHVWFRGMGGGSRLDVPINLIALCRQCHNQVHAGVIRRDDLLAIVALREGMLQDDIEAEINRLKRSPKEKRA